MYIIYDEVFLYKLIYKFLQGVGAQSLSGSLIASSLVDLNASLVVASYEVFCFDELYFS
jgi:hypothetical protein